MSHKSYTKTKLFANPDHVYALTCMFLQRNDGKEQSATYPMKILRRKTMYRILWVSFWIGFS